MTTILITGGIGFIGQYLARRLVDQGCAVLALDSMSPQVHADVDTAVHRFPGPVLAGDVSNPTDWTQIPAVHGVVHLAAETGTGQSMYEVDRYTAVNAHGTRLAARFARDRGVPLIFTSSRAVYGEGRYENSRGTVIFTRPEVPGFAPADSRETDPHHPTSVYGETKSTAERVVLEELGDAGAYAIVRPQNVIGYGQALHNPYTGVLAAFLARLKEGRSLAVYGDGTATRDFIHVDDVAAVLVFALNSALSGRSMVVNAGSGHRVNLTQLAQYAIAGAPQPPVDIEYVDVHRAGDIEHACADLSHLRALGGPLPQWHPADAVADFISRSWEEQSGRSDLWDAALQELSDRGMTT